MAINKKLLIGIIVLLLLVMAALVIKTMSGSSGEDSRPVNAVKGRVDGGNASSLMEMAKEKRARELEALRNEVLKDQNANQSRPSSEENRSAAKTSSTPLQNGSAPYNGANSLNSSTAGQNSTAPANASEIRSASSNAGVNASATPNNQTTSAQTTKAPEAGPVLGTVNVTLESAGKGVIMRITATNPISSYKYATLSSPSRVMVDLSGQWNQGKAPSAAGQNLVSKVRFGRHSDVSRIVADLNTQGQVSVEAKKPSPNQLVFTIKPL